MRIRALRVSTMVCCIFGWPWATPSLRAVGPGLTGHAMDNEDVNGDLDRDLSDPEFRLDHLLPGGSAPLPLADCDANEPAASNGDSNGGAVLGLSDSIHLLNWLFGRGPEPVDACEGPGDATGAHRAHCKNRVAPPDCRAQGQLSITPRAGKATVTTLFARSQERYNNGHPYDPPFPDDFPRSRVSPTLTIVVNPPPGLASFGVIHDNTWILTVTYH